MHLFDTTTPRNPGLESRGIEEEQFQQQRQAAAAVTTGINWPDLQS
jgi:hypothetical protein